MTDITNDDRRAMKKRIETVNLALLDKCDDVLRVLAAELPPPPLPEPGFLRFAADMMALWQLCGHAACRRAKGCRRECGACVARLADRVPHAVRTGAAMMLRGRCLGLSYGALRRSARPEIAAVEAWHAELADHA